MKTDANSASFAQLIGSTKAFNLVEGRGSYVLSPLAMRHFMPTDDGQDRDALLRAIIAPRVFEELVKRFDGGKLPAPDILANILKREYEVSNSWSPRIASLFVGALKFAGAVDSAGFVRYASMLHQIRREAQQLRAFSRNETATSESPQQAPPNDTTASFGTALVRPENDEN